MFSTLSKLFSNLFSRSKPAVQPSVESLLDQQLQSEFARSVKEGMVVTGSQEHAQWSEELQLPHENESLTIQTRKRSAPHDSSSSPISEGSKRRRRNMMPQGLVPSIDAPSRKYGVENDLSRLDEGGKGGERDWSDLQPLEAALKEGVSIVIGSSNPIEETKEVKSSGYEANVGNDLIGPDFAENIDSAIVIEQTKRITETNEDKSIEHGVNSGISKTAPEQPNPVENTDSAATSPKPKHKRFGSEDTNIDQYKSKLGVVTTLSGDSRSGNILGGSNGIESEDEGPETITAAAALNQSRSVATEALRVVERQQAALKKRRKERDRLLKTQAELAKKNKNKENLSEVQSPSQDTFSESVTMIGNEPPKQEKGTTRASLPALLPKELLEEEPIVRPPTPLVNISSNRLSKGSKLKLLNKNSEPPKDIHRGTLSIRVLETNRSLLPPKVSKNSKTIRESWLAGRRGTSFVPRKKLGGGFVRK